MRYSVHPEAEGDLRDAAEFYRERAGPTLSQFFLAEFENGVRLLLQYPSLGAPWRNATRRYLFRRFPYSLVYTISGEVIRILAVAHQNRRPGYWRSRKSDEAVSRDHK